MKQNEEKFMTDEALEALMQEEWMDAMGHLKEEYQNIPVSEQARYAVQKGIERAKIETQLQNQTTQTKRAKRSGRFYGGMAAFATAAATFFVFVLLNTNTQLAVTVAEIPALKPAVELITGREYHEDVYLDIKVAHLAGKDSEHAPLAALFAEDADYITVISEEIQRQIMQSEAYTNLLDKFSQIAPDQHYYLNEAHQLVIVLDEYETAPEFIIEAEVLKSILK